MDQAKGGGDHVTEGLYFACAHFRFTSRRRCTVLGSDVAALRLLEVEDKKLLLLSPAAPRPPLPTPHPHRIQSEPRLVWS